MGFETLIGNALAFLLKNRFTGFATKSIPIALVVWNTFYIMLRAYDPSLVPALPGIGANAGSPPEFNLVGYVFGHDALYHNTGWFSNALGGFGGLFVTAASETAKQMALHAFSKNTIMQWIVPMLAKKN